MKTYSKFSLLLSLLIFASCSKLTRTSKIYSFYFQTVEQVLKEKADLLTYTEISIAGKTQRTNIGKLSESKELRLKVVPGKYLLQMKKFIWDENSGAFRALKSDYQPRERFIEIKAMKGTMVKIKYAPLSRRYKIDVVVGTQH